MDWPLQHSITKTMEVCLPNYRADTPWSFAFLERLDPQIVDIGFPWQDSIYLLFCSFFGLIWTWDQ
ncbi:hypothetical protein SDC9_26234 [bioreactor metagenome]|uniref:Uncharacterized protein n=2 Tax=root TaxID=1 RepID=A0A098AV10_DESHA|nr:hypothetical protein AT727_21365 [Desulfitobacterium hafniense]CDX00383.1 Hypothetical protein DPCES_0496 [Desulfitobacterium hafniense]